MKDGAETNADDGSVTCDVLEGNLRVPERLYQAVQYPELRINKNNT